MDTVSESYRRTFQAREKRLRQKREARRQKALQMAQQVIPPIAATYPSVRRVYLFGSILRPGFFHQQSDIDIALDGSTAHDYFDFWRTLEEAMPNWTIDVRELDNNSFFSNQVRQTGLLLYERKNLYTTS